MALSSDKPVEALESSPIELATQTPRSESPDEYHMSAETVQVSRPTSIITASSRPPTIAGLPTETPRFDSPEPETPTAPVSPISPEDEAHFSIRDSMASIALSDSSLDYDHLSAEQVTDVLRTPRVSSLRGHVRKPSSMEILQNAWQGPSRQSTLFDSMKDEPLDSPGEQLETPTMEFEDDQYTADFGDAASVYGDSLDGSAEVDWQQLDNTEKQEKQDKELPEGTEDESTAFLLARLEQENAKFTADPKSSTPAAVTRLKRESRPPSMSLLKRLVQDRSAPSVRYSLAPDMALPDEPPPMTELEFWTALVQDYPSTAARLPTLTTTKIRSSIPPPLRGVVWTSMSGARDRALEVSYDSLLGEKSPYEGIINKDVGRSFPGVELFRDAEGEGQKMLGRVLKCFSLHDKDIGYCQGLGFLVGPLLMNMGERAAFCVLVRSVPTLLPHITRTC